MKDANRSFYIGAAISAASVFAADGRGKDE